MMQQVLQLLVVPFWLLLLFSSSTKVNGDSTLPTPVGKCENGRMIVSIPRNAIPFKGVLHARGFRSNSACSANSSESTFAPPSLNLNLLAEPGDGDYCGIISLKEGREKAVSIAVRAHSALELQDDKYFLLTCNNLKVATKGSRTSKSLFGREKEDEGLIFYDLEKGHATRPVAILGKGYYFGPKEENHLIGSCVAFGATGDTKSSLVELLDSKGCPSDAAIVNSVEFNRVSEESDSEKSNSGGSESKGRKMRVKIKSMFRFPSQDYKKSSKNEKEAEFWQDNRVTIQCTSVPCDSSGCPSPCTREAGQLLSESSSAQALVSASVNVLNPGLECDHELQHELTRDWLIALLICLAILLLVMFCVNLFLCSSMACTCTKQEIIDTSSLDDRGSSVPGGYDYDPYKVQPISAPGSHIDHPLYASLKRHPHSLHGSSYDVQRESYAIGPSHRRSDSRHSNFY